jgi:hypothetical protein
LVTARASNNSITVSPINGTYPSTQASGFNLYKTFNSIGGLGMFNGLNVAVVSDGYVIASPNNDKDEYATITVTEGYANFPAGIRGAIVHIGLPYVMDVETLDIDTVEERPVLIESKVCDKVYVKVFNTRGLYVANNYPVDGTIVSEMQSIDSMEVDYRQPNPIVANRYEAPQTRRYEITTEGDWKSNGRICLRQVDPVHFEILSIIPDIEDLRR